jgi:putative MATE family efflux protein
MSDRISEEWGNEEKLKENGAEESQALSGRDRRIRTMAEEVPWKAVLKMGLPIAFGMLFMVAYNLVDTYFIGKLGDPYQLAASSLSYPVLMVMIALSGITGNGGASYIARCMGAGRKEEADRTLVLGFEMILVMSLALVLLGAFALDPVVALLGARGETVSYTKDYTGVLLAGSFFTMGNYALGQLLRSEGSVSYATVSMIAGTAANIILDPIFIFTLGMEIKGAAIATVLGNILSTVICLWVYMSGRSLLTLNPRYLGFSARIFGEIMKVGIPHTLEQFLSTASILVLNNLAAAYGGLYVAAMGISSRIMSFGNYLYQGIAAGCQPLMGYNYGAGAYQRMRSLIRSAIGIITLAEVCVMAGFGLSAPFLAGLFTEDPTVVSLAAMTLRAFMLILPFVGTTALVRNVYNAIGMPGFAFAITLVRQLLLYIPFLIFFDRYFGYRGLIHAQPAEELLCLFFSVFLLRRSLSRMEERRGEPGEGR